MPGRVGAGLWQYYKGINKMDEEIKFPKVWIGFLISGLFFITEIIEGILNHGVKNSPNLIDIVFVLGGLVYWLFCVHRIHKILNNVTLDEYPISGRAAVGRSFIPFYNLYWMFKWPAEIINFINTIDSSKNLKRWFPGLVLFLALIVFRAIDGSFGMVIDFAVLVYLVKKIKESISKVELPISDYQSQYKAKGIGWLAITLISIPVIALIAAIAIPNLLRARITSNDALAKATLRALSSASESYATANGGHYPASIETLTSANPPYLINRYCDQSKVGYSYSCQFTDSGYQFTATPVEVGTTGTTTETITTGGVLQP
jgi:type II secretory pathway pseudopilin PulG